MPGTLVGEVMAHQDVAASGPWKQSAELACDRFRGPFGDCGTDSPPRRQLRDTARPTAGRPHIVVEFDTSLLRETTYGFCALEVTPEQPHRAGLHLTVIANAGRAFSREGATPFRPLEATPKGPRRVHESRLSWR